MTCKYWGLNIILLLLLIATALPIAAQPQLPDIAGSIDKGQVSLIWNCQFSGIKSILVRRSWDSVEAYTVIGNVKQTKKGIQVFTDKKPLDGKNYYKLLITFASGLKWSSNHIGIQVGKGNSVPLIAKKIDPIIKVEKKAAPKPAPIKPIKIDTVKPIAKLSTTTPVLSLGSDRDKERERVRETERDRDTNKMPNTSLIARAKRPSLIYKEDAAIVPDVFIPSKYITTDTVLGHVLINLPEDIKLHQYSLKIFDKADHLIMQVPRLNASKIVMDKRNFPKNGIYKFILRKDYNELERGNIVIK